MLFRCKFTSTTTHLLRQAPTARALRQLPNRALSTTPSKGDSSGSATDGKPQPSIPDATTVFKLSNPELMLDPRKSASWAIVFGVIVFFGTYLSWTAYREGLLSDGGQKFAEAHAEEIRQELEVQKVLPDGRLLMRDGSIRKPPQR